MTDVLSNHPIKITLATLVITSIAVVNFTWGAAIDYAQINIKLDCVPKMEESINKNKSDISGMEGDISKIKDDVSDIKFELKRLGLVE